MSGANFSGVEMNHADLRDTDLRGADLSADMVAVNLSGANMVGAEWKTAWLLDAILWNTICPNGEVVVQRCSVGSHQRRSLC